MLDYNIHAMAKLHETYAHIFHKFNLLYNQDINQYQASFKLNSRWIKVVADNLSLLDEQLGRMMQYV